MEDVRLLVERLLNFSIQKRLITLDDMHYCRNFLFELLDLTHLPPLQVEIYEELESAEVILEEILNYCVDIGKIQDLPSERDWFDSKIMNTFLLKPSEIIRRFQKTFRKEGSRSASTQFYEYCCNSNAIRNERVKRNVYWKVNTEFGELEITINRSKPEKDPKEIAKAKLQPQTGYPKCALCLENVGYSGNYASKQSHRVIPIELERESWFFQYSPHEYYPEHCIVIHKDHFPMQINKSSISKLFSFVCMFPHYFVGSNADIPIVGGSILVHQHFQGGNHRFPIENCETEYEFLHPQFPQVKIAIIKWYLSSLKLTSNNKEQLIELSAQILEFWRSYTCEEVEIYASSKLNNDGDNDDNSTVYHNTITPILRFSEDQHLFELYLILRNNRTSETFPDGIFHPHPHLHHIKKENIGLIEAMGLAILPGRLFFELSEIHKVLTGKSQWRDLVLQTPTLGIHSDWVSELLLKYGICCTDDDAHLHLHFEVGMKFSEVLSDSGVFKWNDVGRSAFVNFVSGFEARRILPS